MGFGHEMILAECRGDGFTPRAISGGRGGLRDPRTRRGFVPHSYRTRSSTTRRVDVVNMLHFGAGAIAIKPEVPVIVTLLNVALAAALALWLVNASPTSTFVIIAIDTVDPTCVQFVPSADRYAVM